MRKILFLIICSLLSSTGLYSKTIYVSLAGNNTTGSSPADAYTTIAKAAQNISIGDSLLLRRGDVFRETVDLSTKTGIIIDAFGDKSLVKPVISGSDVITGWSNYKDNIYMSEAIAEPENLFVNGKLMLVARWPNKGWINIDSWTKVNNAVTLSCSKLNQHSPVSDNYWKGTTMRWRRWSWWFEKWSISASTAPDKVTLNGLYTDENDPTGWKFYIDNKFEELDTIGEWIYASGKAYLIHDFPQQNNILIEGSYRDYGLSINSSTIRNVIFCHQYERGLTINGKSIVENCDFQNIGSDNDGDAMFIAYNASQIEVRNNTFTDMLNNAITMNQNRKIQQPNSYIEKNKFLRIGSIPGYGGTGSWHACGIILMGGNNVHIQHNEFDTIGYTAILLGSDKNFAEYNRINAAMYTLNDGAGIYTNCSYSTIRHNIITNTRGNLESSTAWACLGHGIWPEFLSQFHDNLIENNVVVNSGGNGIYHNNLFKNIVSRNTVYNSGTASIRMQGRVAGDQNNLIKNNIFFAAKPEQLCVQFSEQYNYGSFSNNLYANPFDYLTVNGNSMMFTDVWSEKYSWADKNPVNLLFKMPNYIIRGISRNRISNDDFEADELNWVNKTGTQQGISRAVNTSLDGYCMKINSTFGRLQSNYNDSFTLLKDSLYEVKFSYLMNPDDNLENVINKSISLLYIDKSTNRSVGLFNFPATTYRQDAWFILKPLKTYQSATIGFELNTTGDATLNIDNVTFRKVTGREAKVNELTNIHFNYSNNPVAVNLEDRDWYDLDSKIHTDTIQLAPYASKILMRLPYEKNLWFDNEATGFNSPSENNQFCKIFPNPVVSEIYFQSHKAIIKFTIVNAMGKVMDTVTPQNTIFVYSMQHYSKGMYFVQIIDTEGLKQVVKIVKQ